MNTPTAIKVLGILEKEVENYKVPIMDLVATHNDEPFKVLVGTILSARTRDEVTAQACRELFPVVNSFADLKKISESELHAIIRPVGFSQTKAKHLKRLPHVIEEKFGGEIPQTIDELIELPGVGRKTANLVIAIAFKKPAICVDTHVHRITNRLGYVRTKTPLETEMRLRKKLPVEWWRTINRVLVAFGQNTCTPQSPWCSRCPVREECEQIGVSRMR